MTKLRFVAALLLGAVVMLAPASARAVERQAREDILITRDGQFDRPHGIRSGRGTLKDPYVIAGWSVGSVTIKDTTRAVRIIDNTISGTLTLNWNGGRVLVQRNDIGDLRVNENVPRWGKPTSGVIQYNRFGVVGQLRHFDGRFVHNTVGSPDQLGLFSGPGVNFDGFNGALFAYNTIYGYVDARLHGHHHSSGYGKGSHMHAGSHDDGMVDHSRRWHEATIEQNRIVTNNWYALAYLDTDHAANDRTAASETNPSLEAPHVHYTRVHIMDNKLEGAGLLIDVFNATDELHRGLAQGLVDIAGNRITLQHGPFWPFEARYGIEVRQARGLALRIDRNIVQAPSPSLGEPVPRSWQNAGAGILLQGLDRAAVWIRRDRVSNLQFGVQASQMSKSVQWTIERLATDGVDEPVYYDSTVANRPRRK